MNAELLGIVLARIAGTILVDQGKPELGGLLNDLATAYRQGKAVDDILQALSDKWDAQGAPSFDDIAAHRQSIQDRMD